MDKTREARRSTAMAAPNGVTKRRQRISEEMEVVTVRNRPEKTKRDPESLSRSKRRRSGRLAPKKNGIDLVEDSSDESLGDDDVQNRYRRRSLPSDRIPNHAAFLKIADKMIGVPVPRKARSACVKRSHDCRTSSGSGGDGGFGEERRRHSTSSGSFVSQTSSTVSIKRMKTKSGIPKPPKSPVEDDLEIEIAELLSGLKQQSHSSRKEDDSENSLKSSEVKDVEKLKLEGDDGSSALVDKSTKNPEKSLRLIPETHRTNGAGLLVSDIQTEKELNQEKQRLDSRDSMVSKRVSEGPQDGSNCSSKLEIDLTVTPTLPSSREKASVLPLVSDSNVTKDYCKRDSSVKSKEVKNEMNLNLERLSQETGGESSQRSQNLDWRQSQQAKSAQQSSHSPLPVAVSGFPRPKKCVTHLYIARNIQLHKHFSKTNNLFQPNKGSLHPKGGDLRSATRNPSSQKSSPILSLNFQTQDRIAAAPEDKAPQSNPQPPLGSNSVMPPPAFIYPPHYQLQQVMVPSKSPRPTTSINFNHPSSSSAEASSPYFTVLPNNGYPFQLSSAIRGGTPSQAPPFVNGSFYSPQMFQPPPQTLQKPSQAQRETKAGSSSSSSHRQPLQPQVSVNSLSSQRQQSQKSVAKADGQNKTASVPSQNFSMSFTGGAAPANLNFSSNRYHIASATPAVHQKHHQASDSKTGSGSCSAKAEDPKKTLPGKPPELINGQTLVFDNPSRTLNFVSGTWPPPAVLPHHLTQQQSGRSKTILHSQAKSAPATSSKNPATSSLTSCNSLNLKQFQSQQQRQTQISFAVPPKSQPH